MLNRLCSSLRLVQFQSRRWSSQVHFHPTLTKDIFAISFLSRPPVLDDSVTTIGYTKTPDQLSPRSFQENPDFIRLVHAILSSRFKESLTLQTMAKNRLDDGYIHIADERNLPDANRIPWPDDIVASVLVQQTQLVEGSYDPCPTYRLITGDGIMQLNDELHEILLQGLEAASALEAEDIDSS